MIRLSSQPARVSFRFRLAAWAAVVAAQDGTLKGKLGNAISTNASNNPTFDREHGRIARAEISRGKLLAGRHTCSVLCRQLKLDEDLGAYFIPHGRGTS